jgi:hypothetical protein
LRLPLKTPLLRISFANIYIVNQLEMQDPPVRIYAEKRLLKT